MMNTQVFCVRHARPHLRLASVHRNDVPTVVAFRTMADAQLGREVMCNQTWAYEAWGDVLIMMPLTMIVEDSSMGIWKATPNSLLRHGVNKFGLDICEVNAFNTICVRRAMFVNKELDKETVSRQLQSSFDLML